MLFSEACAEKLWCICMNKIQTPFYLAALLMHNVTEFDLSSDSPILRQPLNLSIVLSTHLLIVLSPVHQFHAESNRLTTGMLPISNIIILMTI
jgi:hypothetical protein